MLKYIKLHYNILLFFLAILNYLPHTLSLKSLHRVLPKDDVITFQKCSEMCNQIMHAEHVKSLIIETGQQLLSTLKLWALASLSFNNSIGPILF